MFRINKDVAYPSHAISFRDADQNHIVSKTYLQFFMWACELVRMGWEMYDELGENEKFSNGENPFYVKFEVCVKRNEQKSETDVVIEQLFQQLFNKNRSVVPEEMLKLDLFMDGNPTVGEYRLWWYVKTPSISSADVASRVIQKNKEWCEKVRKGDVRVNGTLVTEPAKAIRPHEVYRLIDSNTQLAEIIDVVTKCEYKLSAQKDSGKIKLDIATPGHPLNPFTLFNPVRSLSRKDARVMPQQLLLTSYIKRYTLDERGREVELPGLGDGPLVPPMGAAAAAAAAANDNDNDNDAEGSMANPGPVQANNALQANAAAAAGPNAGQIFFKYVHATPNCVLKINACSPQVMYDRYFPDYIKRAGFHLVNDALMERLSVIQQLPVAGGGGGGTGDDSNDPQDDGLDNYGERPGAMRDAARYLLHRDDINSDAQGMIELQKLIGVNVTDKGL